MCLAQLVLQKSDSNQGCFQNNNNRTTNISMIQTSLKIHM